jgi:hypothetical protein
MRARVKGKGDELMALAGEGRIWDDASAPAAAGLAGRFAEAWRARPDDPPDPLDFLPEEHTNGDGNGDGPARRDAALLALLRTDLALRREAGEPARAERYLRRCPDLPREVLVALVYEEFCLREEAGEAPDPAEYEARFPGVAAQLREVLDIHEFVGSAHEALTSTFARHGTARRSAVTG